MFKKNEVGLTLIELLLALSIATTIGILILSVFFQGLNYSNKAMTKNQMQQEVNIIISSLTKYHRTVDSFEILSSNCKISISSSSIVVYEHPQLCFETNKTGTIQPKTEDVLLTINVSDKNDPSNHIEIDTVLSRLKSGDGDEEENK